MSRTALAMSLLVLCLGGAGCGSDDEKSSSVPSSSVPATTPPATTSTEPAGSSGSAADIAAIRKTIAAWAGADNPEKVCELMSAGLKSELLGPEQRECQDKKAMEAKLGVELTPSTLRIASVRVTGDTAVVKTKGGSDDVYTVIRETGSWKINGVDRPNPKFAPQGTVTQDPVT